MKEYPLDEAELNELGGLGVIASLFFSVAAFALGFALDISKDLALTPDASESARTFWGTLRGVAFAVAGVGGLSGGLVVWRRGTRVQEIKDSTSHD